MSFTARDVSETILKLVIIPPACKLPPSKALKANTKPVLNVKVWFSKLKKWYRRRISITNPACLAGIAWKSLILPTSLMPMMARFIADNATLTSLVPGAGPSQLALWITKRSKVLPMILANVADAKAGFMRLRKWLLNVAGFILTASNASVAANFWMLPATKMDPMTESFAELATKTCWMRWQEATWNMPKLWPRQVSSSVMIQRLAVLDAKESCLMRKKWPWDQGHITKNASLVPLVIGKNFWSLSGLEPFTSGFCLQEFGLFACGRWTSDDQRRVLPILLHQELWPHWDEVQHQLRPWHHQDRRRPRGSLPTLPGCSLSRRRSVG